MREDEFKVGDRVITNSGAIVGANQTGEIIRSNGIVVVRMDNPACTTNCIDFGFYRITDYNARRFLSKTGPKKKRKTGFGKFASSKFPDTNQIGT